MFFKTSRSENLKTVNPRPERYVALIPSCSIPDNQLTCGAVKVHDIVPNIFLSVKLVTSDAFLSNVLPELKFCIRGVFAESSGESLEFSIEWEH